jgi:hypothetical protein
MMKRLVALLLVLGMASAANAVYLQVDGVAADSLELVEGTTSVITVVGEDGSSWLGYLIIEDGGAGTLSDITALDAAGDMASAESYEEAGWGVGYQLTTGSGPGSSMPISAGSQFNVTFSGGSQGQTAKISLYLDPEYTTPVSSVDVSIVPEPITIALLGFGALFIRRRK